MHRSLILTFLLGLCPLAQAATVEAEAAWIRAAPPTAKMLAGYVVLHNRGSESVALVGAASERFGMAEVHETIEVDGMARMREVPRIELAPGASAALEPGGRHLMLMRPASVPAEGEQVRILLKLSDGSELPVLFEVSRSAPGVADGEDESADHEGHAHH